MKDCKKIHPLLSLYLDDQLSSADKNKVEKHLGLCEDARLDLEKIQDLIRNLHNMPEPPVPADLHDKIMSKLGRASIPLPAPRRFWGPPAWAMSAAAVLLFVLLNQYPGWHDLSKMNRSRQERDETLGPQAQTAATAPSRLDNKNSTNTFTATSTNEKSAPAPPAGTNLYAPAQPDAAGLKNIADIKSNAVPNPEVNQVFQKDAALGLKKEPMAQDYAVSGSTQLDEVITKSEPLNRAARASKAKSTTWKKTLVSAPPATLQAHYAPAEALPEPTPTIEPLDKSVKSLPYSREEYVTTWKGNNGPATVESQELVTDAETLKKYWSLPHPGEAPPAVDFTKEAVVILMAGGKPTAGYSIYVSKLEEKADQLVIHYRLDSPAVDAVTAQVLTQPWSLQVIPKPLKPVVFIKDP